MFPDPPDDGRRTVLCQTCDEWRHPRHSCARAPDHETAPLPVLRLRRDGPSVLEGFDDSASRMNPEARRQHATGKFDPMTHADGPSSTFGATRAVYYLIDEHDPADVITTWLEVNEGTLSGRELTTENLTRALSNGEFEDAWRGLRESRDFAVLDEPEYGDRGGGDHSETTECPFCDQTITRLPAHLPCEATTNDG